jgi:hypothetical protein
MTEQPRGPYEALITEALAVRLRDLDDRLRAHRDPLRPAEAVRVALQTISPGTTLPQRRRAGFPGGWL